MDPTATALDWLAAVLLAVATKARPETPFNAHVTDYNVRAAAFHAVQVRGSWLWWCKRLDIVAVQVGGTERLRTRHVLAERSTTKELKKLLVAARGTSREKFNKQWLDTSGRTKALILGRWSALPPPVITREVDGVLHLVRSNFTAPHRRMSVGKHTAIFPLPHEAARLIADALRQHLSMSSSERQRRMADTLADDLAGAVVRAHRALTGKWGLAWNDRTSRHEGSLLDLVNRVEVQFDFENRWWLSMMDRGQRLKGRRKQDRRRRSALTIDRLRKFIFPSLSD